MDLHSPLPSYDDRGPQEFTDEPFRRWMSRIDHILMEVVAIDHTDLPDINFRGRYADECEPQEVAAELLEESGADESLVLAAETMSC